MDSSMRPDPEWDVTTVGELLGVFTPLDPGPIEDVTYFQKGVGGAEVNVAIGLARLGHRVQWAGRVGADSIGRDGLRTLRAEGVGIRHAERDSRAPTGIYVKELVGPHQVHVAYYRAGSAATTMAYDDLDAGALLECRVLHMTGITPLLSASCHDLTVRLIDEARARGVTVSFDANIRCSLLGDREPVPLLMPLVERSHLVFLAASESELLFGTADADALPARLPSGRLSTYVVHHEAAAFAVDPHGAVSQRSTRPVPVVDPVGAGDAFVCGYLCGWLRSFSPAKALLLAHTCASRVVGGRGDNRGLPHEADALAFVGDHPAVEEPGEP
jgi:2-dehydro-3-deoxygluconokinase